MLSAVRSVDCGNWIFITNSPAAVTNVDLNAIADDPLQKTPTIVMDLGTNQGTIVKKELYNGDIAVAVFNESTATNGWCPTITWSMLGLNTNDVYAVTKVFSSGEFGFWPYTNSGGIFANLALNPTGAVLLRLSKTSIAGVAVALTNQPALFSVVALPMAFEFNIN